MITVSEVDGAIDQITATSATVTIERMGDCIVIVINDGHRRLSIFTDGMDSIEVHSDEASP